MKKCLLFILVCLVAMAQLLVGCGGNSDKAKARTGVKLAAAASLEKVFVKELIPGFEKKYPQYFVEGTYDSSGKLQKQIEQGLKADVFFSAGVKQMEALKQKKYMLDSSVRPLLENKLVLIVPKDYQGAVKGFKDFALAKHPAVGDPKSVPAGQYAKEALVKLQLWDKIQGKASLGTNVTQVLEWVASGSADAGLVYATDAASSKSVKVVEAAAPGLLSKPIIYPIGRLAKVNDEKATQCFLEYLQSEEAKKCFEKYGFSSCK